MPISARSSTIYGFRHQPQCGRRGHFFISFEHDDIAYDTTRIRRDLAYKEPVEYTEGMRRTGLLLP